MNQMTADDSPIVPTPYLQRCVRGRSAYRRSLLALGVLAFGGLPLVGGVIPGRAALDRSNQPTDSTFLQPASETRPSTSRSPTTAPTLDADQLRAAYSLPPDQWPAATWDESIPLADRHELGPVPEMTFPADNPYSDAKSMLGWKLFYDPRLSSSGAVACVSCHHPDLGWADGKTTSQGHRLQPLDRNAPTLLGVGFEKQFMWDGRADSLEDQALLPLANSKEMHGEFDDVVKTVGEISGYREEFKTVFGDDAINIGRITQAIATFERTIVPGRSPFDAFLKGKTRALGDAELRGLHLFRTKARCINCHNGPLMTDGQFHNLGLTFYGRKYQDLGRYLETKDPKDVGAFKTPTLRNIGRTAPYMHNGLFELQGVLNLYNVGMPTEKVPPNDPLAPHKSPLLKRLDLTAQERSDLIEFLRDALEEPRLRVRSPKIPGLYEDPATQPTTEPAEADVADPK